MEGKEVVRRVTLGKNGAREAVRRLPGARRKDLQQIERDTWTEWRFWEEKTCLVEDLSGRRAWQGGAGRLGAFVEMRRSQGRESTDGGQLYTSYPISTLQNQDFPNSSLRGLLERTHRANSNKVRHVPNGVETTEL